MPYTPITLVHCSKDNNEHTCLVLFQEHGKEVSCSLFLGY